MKVLHAADLHIDSPLQGLSAYEGAPEDEIRGSTRRAVEAMVRTAIDERVDLVVVAGDVFDGDWRDYGTGLFWIGQLARLHDENIPVITVAGNHDAASEISHNLTLPPNVVQLAGDHPDRRVLDDLEVEVIGQSYATRAVTQDLTSAFPHGDPALFSIGLLHTSLTGRQNHAPYAPCNPDGLKSLGYEYWALGHVHAREVVSTDPWIVFPGNTQGRHVRETGPKGVSIIEIESRHVQDVRPVVLDTVRWNRVEVPVDDLSDVDQVLERTARRFDELRSDLEGRLGVVRVELTGASKVHPALWRNPAGFENEVRALAVRTGHLWVEKVRLSTTRHVDVDKLRSDEAVAALIDGIEALKCDPALLEPYEELFTDLRAKIGADVHIGEAHEFDPSAVGTAETLATQLDASLETILEALSRDEHGGDR